MILPVQIQPAGPRHLTQYHVCSSVTKNPFRKNHAPHNAAVLVHTLRSCPVHGERQQKIMRPSLTRMISVEEFEDWYWKKEELVVFCKHQSIPSGGSKPDLEIRIKAYLRGETLPKHEKQKTGKKIPDHLTLDTLIEEGWSCNPKLGRFFKDHCGKSFRFNHAMRQFIHTQAGKRLRDAVVCYKDSLTTRQPSLPQNELAAFMRNYSQANPGCSRKEIMLEWERVKSKSRSERR